MEHGVTALTWVTLALMIFAAKLGGEAAIRLRQPAVLGELLAGVLLGNLPLTLIHEAAQGPAIGFAAEIGVMLLLFQVGLESSVGEMAKIAPKAGLVALLGVAVPSALGIGASRLMLPDAPLPLHLFIGATLCATSVGITASVLKDVGALATAEARVILGAAVIDDVLGLMVLAIVSAVAAQGVFPDALTLGRITGTAVAFLVGALFIGLFVTRGVYRVAAALRAPHVLGAISIALCMLLAGASATAGLAAIVGAYAAGLILDEVSIRPFGEGGLHKVDEFVSPIVAVFAPVFFVRTGMNVHLGGLGGDVLLFTGLLIIAALVGKLASGLGIRGKGIDRLTVGLGMTPRGEVGLIFADVGAHLVVGGNPLFPPAIYASVVATVFVTTFVAPPALIWRIRVRKKRETDEPSAA
jgi:Kef-type K+ transport system membrane component KefB